VCAKEFAKKKKRGREGNLSALPIIKQNNVANVVKAEVRSRQWEV